MWIYYVVSFVIVIGGLGVVNSFMVHYNDLINISKDLNDSN